MATKILYSNKIVLQNDETIPSENKVTADDMNEIKEVVNNNADELETKQGKEEGKGLSTNDFTDELKEKLESLENYDDTELKQKNAEQDITIEELKAENIELKAENERLNNDINAISVTERAEGENITLNDTAEARFKSFGIGGNSWQKTREGYNLANLDKETYTISGVTVTNDGDGSFTLNGETTSGLDIVLTKNASMDKLIYEFEEGTYLLKTIVESGSFNNDNNRTVQTSLLGKNGDNYDYGMMKNTLSASVFATTKALTTDYKLSRIEIYVGGAGVVFNNYKIKVLLAKSSDTNLAWEPYGAMPSTEFESDIQNVTGNANFKITNGLEDTDTNYEEQSFTFPLQEGQKLMLNDYLADDGIHHKRGQAEFDGTENWSIYRGGLNDEVFKVQAVLSDLNQKGAWGVKSLMSNYFKDIASEIYTTTTLNGIATDNIKNHILMSINIKYLDSLDINGFKTYLAKQYANGTPVVVEYDLAEEEIEAYTPEQQAVYDEIKKTAHSYGEQTHIFCTDETSLIFSVEAKKDMNTVISNLESMILANASEEV